MSNNATDRQTVNTYCDSSFLDAGMLSAPQIHYFAQKYNIIDGFDEKQLKAAVYEMRLGEVAVRWEGKTELRFDLNSGNPSRWDTFLEKASGLDIFPLNYVPTLITSSTLLLPPNSLTFVTTVERFNLPRDIIARFNLKSKLVHKGLLLGTGPIVDPGFKSKIVIPLHNFSNIPLQLKYNEGFISVEFTRTLNPDKDNIDGYDVKRVQNDSANTPVEEFFKNTKYVESSVYSALSQSERMVKRANTTVKRLTGIGIIAILALFIASWSLIDSVYDNSNTANIQVHKAQSMLTDFSDKYLDRINQIQEELNGIKANIEAIRNNPDLNSDVNALFNRVTALEQQLQQLQVKADVLRTPVEPK